MLKAKQGQKRLWGRLLCNMSSDRENARRTRPQATVLEVKLKLEEGW